METLICSNRSLSSYRGFILGDAIKGISSDSIWIDESGTIPEHDVSNPDIRVGRLLTHFLMRVIIIVVLMTLNCGSTTSIRHWCCWSDWHGIELLVQHPYITLYAVLFKEDITDLKHCPVSPYVIPTQVGIQAG